ncbi:MAG: threonine synthase [Firmicutes bacterium]|nr:threonine synthase [Bacillota bacterium]
MTTINYKSTRQEGHNVSAATAILTGIAPDGGLYVPTRIPKIDKTFSELAALNYRQLAVYLLSLYLTDFTEAEITKAVDCAYDDKFRTPQIAQLETKNNTHFLELFHGPTLAFKDMALALLPYLLKTAAQKTGQKKEIVILTATSGDTGKAALEGFAGVEGTKIIVFFPEHGVSRVQKRQMVTQRGKNTYVIGIEGNFDDAQNGVKAIFTDPVLRQKLAENGYMFSSANSINIGRLLPQIVYYVWAYLELLRRGCIKTGEKINFCVPTGNFGNILAAYYAEQMGLPVGKLICASNKNKVLFDFFTTKIYDRKREFFVTSSPSMDILISSNLERLLYHAAGENSEQVRAWMEDLKTKGSYEIPAETAAALKSFAAGFATEAETKASIREVFEASGYLIDTHTAVAYSVLQKYQKETLDGAPAVVVATASPYKFSKDVLCALEEKFAQVDDFALFKEMEKISQVEIPAPIRDLKERPVLHRQVCRPEEMPQVVSEILGL